MKVKRNNYFLKGIRTGVIQLRKKRTFYSTRETHIGKSWPQDRNPNFQGRDPANSRCEIRSWGEHPHERKEHNHVSLLQLPGWGRNPACQFCSFLLTVQSVICSIWMTATQTTWELLVKHCAQKWKKFGNRNTVFIMPSNSRLRTWKKTNPGSKLVARQALSQRRVGLHQGEGLSMQIGVREPGCRLLGQGDWGTGRRLLTHRSGNSKPTEPEIVWGGKEGLVVLIETWRIGLIDFTNTYQAIIWLNKKIMFLLIENGQMKTISLFNQQ